ncbi:MAG: 23S rRNA (guanosine(2251)-2'-O)-methyltransferase RlmB [Bacillota bacterium]
MDQKIAGRRAVMEVLVSGRPVSRILLAEGIPDPGVEPILKAARIRGVSVERTARKELDRLLGSKMHQGVLAMVQARDYVDIEDILEVAKDQGEMPLVLLADSVQDPQNLGAIIRTAEAAGVHGLILPKRRSADVSPGTVKASAGASEHLAICRVTNLPRAMDSLKDRGIWVIGASPQASNVLWETDLNIPLGIVVGGEHSGLGRLVVDKCDFTVSIPMKGHVGSLNVSAATAVMLYEVLRQRRHALLDS